MGMVSWYCQSLWIRSAVVSWHERADQEIQRWFFCFCTDFQCEIMRSLYISLWGGRSALLARSSGPSKERVESTRLWLMWHAEWKYSLMVIRHFLAFIISFFISVMKYFIHFFSFGVSPRFSSFLLVSPLLGDVSAQAGPKGPGHDPTGAKGSETPDLSDLWHLNISTNLNEEVSHSDLWTSTPFCLLSTWTLFAAFSTQ